MVVTTQTVFVALTLTVICVGRVDGRSINNGIIITIISNIIITVSISGGSNCGEFW